MRRIVGQMRNRRVFKVLYLVALMTGIIVLSPQADVKAYCYDCFDGYSETAGQFCAVWDDYGCCVWWCWDQNNEFFAQVNNHWCHYPNCEAE